MRLFETGDGLEKVPGVVWVLAIGAVTSVVVAVGVALMAGGGWVIDWLSRG